MEAVALSIETIPDAERFNNFKLMQTINDRREYRHGDTFDGMDACTFMNVMYTSV